MEERDKVTTSLPVAGPHRLGLLSLTLFLTQLSTKVFSNVSKLWVKYVKLMQRLSGFKGKDILNMDSTKETFMITIIDDLSQLSLRPTPVPK